jgi:hypothetical protein
VAAAALTRSRLPLLAAVPYTQQLARRARPYRRRAPLVAAVDVAADALTCAALAQGSVRNRSLVI